MFSRVWCGDYYGWCSECLELDAVFRTLLLAMAFSTYMKVRLAGIRSNTRIYVKVCQWAEVNVVDVIGRTTPPRQPRRPKMHESTNSNKPCLCLCKAPEKC